MAAFDPATLDRWRALAIVDREGTTVGTISEFYLDRETGHPTWALVDTGLFGQTQTFVPLVHATEISDGLQVPYEKDHIRNTPKVDLHDELSSQEEAELFAHYGVEYVPSGQDATEADSDAEPVTSGSPTVEGDEGPGPVRAAPGLAGSSADAGQGEPPEAVPAEPGSVDRSGAVATGPQADEATATTAAGPEPRPDGASDTVPDEPGTAEPDETRQADSDRSGDAGSSGSGAGPTEAASSRFGAGSLGPEAEHGRNRTGFGHAPSRSSDHDPDLARTAPVEPGLPGSTAASPYGPTPTVDKAASPSGASAAEATPSAPEEPAWAPGSAGSFEAPEPHDRPRGSTDRWREAKLAAERERIAREAGEPEERSPLERARRRLERLVGGGQDHHDEASGADREAAERARRARLGIDDDDDYRRR